MMRRFFAVTLVFLAFAFIACENEDGPSGAATSTAVGSTAMTALTPVATTPSQAAACSPDREHEAGDFDRMITSGGRLRDYILHIPASYIGDEAVPLVLNLHGFGSNATQQERYSGLPTKADAEGFIVITPQGLGEEPFWNAFGIRSLQDDVAFMRDLIDTAERDLCVDAARVYAAGISNGAAMSVRLACDVSDRIAAIAPVAGVSFPANCAPSRAVPVIAFHGTADAVVPYEGGPVRAGISQQLGLQAPPVEDSVADWAAHSECLSDPAAEQTANHVQHVSYDGCAEDATVELYTIEDGGHTWPGAIDVPRLGATTHEISATDLIWDFFAAHPMP